MLVFLQQARITLRLALPMVVGQVSQMLLGLVDSIMIGQLGAVPLAASAFAGGVFMLFFMVGIGLLLPVALLVSRAHGAGRAGEVARWLHHGTVLALLGGVVEVGVMLALWTVSDRLGQPPEVLAAAGPFYGLIALSLLPAMLFQVFRQYAEALGRPWVPMALMLGGVALNVGLNWVLIYGRLGAPELGLAGAGWATLVARVAVLVAILVWLRGTGGFSAVRPKHWLGGLKAARFREILRLGGPAAAMFFMEVGAFMAATLIMGWLGAAALAAHQIALSCAGFMFMFPLGLSMAVGMRLAKAQGEGRPDLLRPIAGGALAMGLAVMSVSAVGFAVFGEELARGFVADTAVVGLATQLLAVAAIFQLFDAAQVIGAGALRGLADVRVPTGITFVAYWLLAIPCAYGLGLHTGLGAVGVWIGLAAGLGVAAVLLGQRFWRLTGLTGMSPPVSPTQSVT
jgi:MATE family multidrug resistance protein